MSIQDDFLTLTQPHPVMWEDPETGAMETREEQGLITQLHDAVFGGMESTGGMSGFKAKLPISAGALDLYEQIDQEIAETWGWLFPDQIPGVVKLERLLSQVAAVATPDDQVTITEATQRIDHPGTRYEHWWVERTPKTFTVAKLFQRWVQQIRDFFDPPRTAEIQAPCLQCDEEWAWKNVSGENVKYRVLVFIRNENGDSIEARCLSCGASWRRDQFQFLLEALQEQAKRHAPVDA